MSTELKLSKTLQKLGQLVTSDQGSGHAIMFDLFFSIVAPLGVLIREDSASCALVRGYLPHSGVVSRNVGLLRAAPYWSLGLQSPVSTAMREGVRLLVKKKKKKKAG